MGPEQRIRHTRNSDSPSRSRPGLIALFPLALLAPACLNFECSEFDSTCRTEALLPWLFLAGPNSTSNESGADPETTVAACSTYAPGRVSVASDGSQATGGNSQLPFISANGRFVTFSSSATNLVAGDTNGVADVFLHDRATGATTRVSLANGGGEATGGESTGSAISDDGRYVAFLSEATNLVAGDTNGMRDAFLHDRETSTTTRISVSTGGVEGDQNAFEVAMGSSNRYIGFASSATTMVAGDTNGLADIFLYDTDTAVTTRGSVASGGTEGTGGTSSQSISLTADAAALVFFTDNSNIVAGDTNGTNDVFLRRPAADTTERVSVATGGVEGTGGDALQAAISGDGRIVTYMASMTNLVAGDTNAAQDIFVYEIDTGTTTRVSVSSGGAEATGANNAPAVNMDGRYVAFLSGANNLVSGDTNGASDVFLHDRQTATTSRISVSLSDGAEANGGSNAVQLSRDCPYIVIHSAASNLVSGDTNGTVDVFVYDRP